MNTIDEYLDAAIARCGCRSDRDLSTRLGLAGQAVCHYRTKRAWPADDTMRKIAEMAGEDPHIAVIRLNIWRTMNTPVAKVYSDILAKLTGLAASLALLVVLLMPADARAVNATGTNHHPECASVYYGKTSFLSGRIAINDLGVPRLWVTIWRLWKSSISRSPNRSMASPAWATCQDAARR